MKRKVVLHGYSTLIVSLPSKWVKRYGIKKGDELDIKEEQNRLIISTDSSKKLDKTEIDITGLDRTMIMYTIRSLYRKGYDEIKVIFKNPMTTYYRIGREMKVISVIHQEVNRLIGVEVMQEHEDYCIIKDLQQTSTKDFDQILRRIFMLIQTAMDDLLKGISKGDNVLLDTVKEKHDTITKFVSYCLRMLNKRGYIEPKNTLYLYHIIATLDRITDNIKYLARDTLNFEVKFSAKGISILENIVKSLKIYTDIFYKVSTDKIIELSRLREKTSRMISNSINTLPAKELMLLKYMYHTLEMLLDLTEARMGLEY